MQDKEHRFDIKNNACIFYSGPGGSVTIPDGVTTVDLKGTRLYEITELTLPDSVEEIKDYVFHRCGPNRINFGKGIKRIGSYAFNGKCFKTANISDLASWCSIELGYSITDTINILTSPDAPDSAAALLVNGVSAEELVIPDGVTRISSYAFSGFGNIKKLVIPDSVTEIGEKAFYCCVSLCDITFGKGIKTIGKEAFNLCGYCSA